MTATMIYPDDTARARRTDPLSSHVGGDKSAANIHEVKQAVLVLLRQEGELTGNEINDLYDLRSARSDWPRVASETPRKRTEEMAKDGLIRILNPDDSRGKPRVYALLEEGE